MAQQRKPRIRLYLGFLTILALVVSPRAAQAQARFVPLGDLPGGEFGSAARAVSDDGAAAGSSRSAEGLEAFVWTERDGMIGLGDIPGGSFESQGRGVASGGRAVVGTGHGGPNNTNIAFYWTAENGLTDLGGVTVIDATAVTPDGTVVVGLGSFDFHTEAFRWTSSRGFTPLGDLPGGEDYSWAVAVSANGSAVAGRSKSLSGTEAFRWTRATGMVGLGDLPGGNFYSAAWAISADGESVVGESKAGNVTEAFLWDPDQGMISLGDLPGRSFRSVGLGVSGDGTVVVGQSDNPVRAIIWDANHGMRDLQEVLKTDYGLELNGWEIRFAYAVSPSARYIVGSGRNPDGIDEAWLVDLSGSGDDCDRIRRLRAKCADHKLKARLTADLPEGSAFTLRVNDAAPKVCVLKGRGKCKVRWKGQHGRRVVTVDECPDVSRIADCA